MLLDEQFEENSFDFKVANCVGQDAVVISSNSSSKKSAKKATDYDDVITTGNSRAYPNQQASIQVLLEANPTMILVLLGVPYEANLYTYASTILCVYEYTSLSVISVIKALTNEACITGGLPVIVQGFND